MPAIRPAACDQRPGSRSCSLWYIAGRLGHREKSVAWLARYVGALIAKEGFPPALVLYDIRGGRVDRLGAASRWILEPVDMWFDGQPAARIPARLLESASEALISRYAETLDARAGALGGGAA